MPEILWEPCYGCVVDLMRVVALYGFAPNLWHPCKECQQRLIEALARQERNDEGPA